MSEQGLRVRARQYFRSRECGARKRWLGEISPAVAAKSFLARRGFSRWISRGNSRLHPASAPRRGRVRHKPWPGPRPAGAEDTGKVALRPCNEATGGAGCSGRAILRDALEGNSVGQPLPSTPDPRYREEDAAVLSYFSDADPHTSRADLHAPTRRREDAGRLEFLTLRGIGSTLGSRRRTTADRPSLSQLVEPLTFL